MGNPNFMIIRVVIGTRAAHSVLCLTADLTTGVRSPAEAEGFSSSLCVQSSSEAHPASYSMGPGGPFPGTKRGRKMALTAYTHLELRLRMSRKYASLTPAWR
jgi:hypothetical protein